MATLRLKIPPVVILLIAAAAMWLLARATPQFQFPLPGKVAIATGFLTAGLIVIGLGVATFRRAQTTVNPRQPQNTSALVTSGIYRVTRNPMYLGMLLVLIAWGAMLRHGLALGVLPGFVLYLNRFQIAPEEAALTNLFGQPFRDYSQQVRRWL
jgi:protein-S-isoprenylcysteine O-methyltransferase Ste14